MHWPGAVIFPNALDIAGVVRQRHTEGRDVDTEDLAQVSPYLTEHIVRFGQYSTHEPGIRPEAYETRLEAGSPRCATRI